MRRSCPSCPAAPASPRPPDLLRSTPQLEPGPCCCLQALKNTIFHRMTDFVFCFLQKKRYPFGCCMTRSSSLAPRSSSSSVPTTKGGRWPVQKKRAILLYFPHAKKNWEIAWNSKAINEHTGTSKGISCTANESQTISLYAAVICIQFEVEICRHIEKCTE